VNTGRLTAAAIALTVVIAGLVLLLGDGWLAPGPTSPTSRTPPATAPTPAPTAFVRCTRETEPLPSALATDPCPGAILAVELAVATVRLPIERLVIDPGPFYCDNLWPGVATPRACSGFVVRPGQFMHAWVSFVGSEEVAAVALGLDFPDDLAAPGATRPPWNATLATVQVPPAGWVMP
jgi:hypothetical protein